MASLERITPESMYKHSVTCGIGAQLLMDIKEMRFCIAMRYLTKNTK